MDIYWTVGVILLMTGGTFTLVGAHTDSLLGYNTSWTKVVYAGIAGLVLGLIILTLRFIALIW